MPVIYVDGKKITLADSDYLASGGEAKVYLQDGLVYKIWDQAPASNYRQKLDLLKPLASHPAIIAPAALALDKSGRLLGYAMAPVIDAVPLPRLFTTAWQTKNGLDPASLNQLVTGMVDTIKFIHSHGILMVDGNELNYLVSGLGNGGALADAGRVNFIDVDSWQLPGFPATVIMPSIRDWSAVQFNQDSDWFSFAIIATQLYLGIHPFKGTWQPDPGLKDIKERQLKHLSVFNPAVSLPAAARPVSLIPGKFRDWLIALFEHGLRGPPPLPQGPSGQLANPGLVATASSSHTPLKLTLVQEWPDAIRSVWLIGPERWVLDGSKLYRNHVPLPGSTSCAGIVSGPGGPWFLVEGGPGRAAALVQAAGSGQIDLGEYQASKLLTIDGRLYALSRQALIELAPLDMGGRWRLVERQRWPIAGQSTQAGDGVLVSDCLGAAFLHVPWQAGASTILRASEIDGHRLIAAQAIGRVITSMTAFGGRFFRSQWHLDGDREKIIWTRHETVDEPAALQFALVKDSLLIEYLPDDSLRLLPVGGGTERLVPACGLVGSTQILADSQDVLVVRGGQLLRASLGA